MPPNQLKSKSSVRKLLKAALTELKPQVREGKLTTEKKRHPITGCRADTLMGVWLIDSRILEQYQNLVSTHDLVALKQMSADMPMAQTNTVGKIARISINGPTTKYPTSFSAIAGGTSTARIQKLINQSLADPNISAILLDVDSPGGTTHGSFDLADTIAKASKLKPVIVFGNGDMTSAAMLTASQASYIIATPETSVGSIGVKAVLKDTSEAHAKMGVRVIPVTSGKLKALAESGTPITKSEVDRVQALVDEINTMFVSYVAKGRNLKAETIQGFEGNFFRAAKGKDLGLIDEVGDEDRALALASEAASDPAKFLSRKSSTPAGALPAAAPNPEADTSDRSKRTMLTPQQMAQAKQLPGANANMTAETADADLLAIANALHVENTTLKAAKPAALPEAMANQYVALAHGNIDLLTKQEKMLPAQAEMLKGFITKDTVASDGKINLSLEQFNKVMDTNQPSGLQDEKTPVQKQARAIPGGEKDETKPVTEAELTQLLSGFDLGRQFLANAASNGRH